MSAVPRRGRNPSWWFAAGLLCFGSPAWASSHIEWDAPASCPGRAALTARLSALLEADTALLAGTARVRGVVSRDDGGYRVVLEVDEAGRRSARTLEADDCADLTEAAALAIALALHAQPSDPDTPGAGTSQASVSTASSPASAASAANAGSVVVDESVAARGEHRR